MSLSKQQQQQQLLLWARRANQPNARIDSSKQAADNPAAISPSPPWPPRTYNPQDGRGSRKPASQDQAMKELVEVVEKLQPDG